MLFGVGLMLPPFVVFRIWVSFFILGQDSIFGTHFTQKEWFTCYTRNAYGYSLTRCTSCLGRVRVLSAVYESPGCFQPLVAYRPPTLRPARDIGSLSEALRQVKHFENKAGVRAVLGLPFMFISIQSA
jgi:hypothetical protein